MPTDMQGEICLRRIQDLSTKQTEQPDSIPLLYHKQVFALKGKSNLLGKSQSPVTICLVQLYNRGQPAQEGPVHVLQFPLLSS